jgi:hypothetical protein
MIPYYLPDSTVDKEHIISKLDKPLLASFDEINNLVSRESCSSVDLESCHDYEENWEEMF